MPRRDALRRVGAGGVAAGLFLGARAAMSRAQTPLPSAPAEAAARRVIDAIDRALASGDMTALDLVFAPDYVNHTPHRSPRSGQRFSADLAGLKVALTELRGIAPDAVLIVEDVVGSGDMAAIRATFEGTVDPALVPLPPGTRNPLRIGGVAFARFVNGQVVESWDYNEAAELYGGLSRPAATPTPPPTVPPVEEGEVREVRDFQEVSLEGIGTLLITQGETESLTIEAEPKVLDRIATEVRRGKLTIRPARSFKTDKPVIYHLTVKQLSSIELSGAGRVEADSLTADQLRLSVQQGGAVSIADLTANALEVDAQGNAQIELAGAVDQQTVSLTGAGAYAAAELASRVASVSVDGAAQATVNVSERLQASAGGASKVMYIGNPQIQQQTSAAGSVVKIG